MPDANDGPQVSNDATTSWRYEDFFQEFMPFIEKTLPCKADKH